MPESSFRNLSNLGYLSLANNNLKEIPRHILAHMPKILTIDLGCGNIETVRTDDFQHLLDVNYLVLYSNNIKTVEKESIPRTVRILHLGRNNLTSMNGTLRYHEGMDVLFLNHNNLTTLDDELPIRSTHFKSLTAHHNKLRNLPRDLTHFPYLDTLYLSDNEIRSLDGVISNASYLQTLSVYNNKIEYLAADEFAHSLELYDLDLANNLIKSINGSMLSLVKIRMCNLSRNVIEEFRLDDVRGLRELQIMDLSYNRIVKVTTSTQNVVEQEFYFVELRLGHNSLKSLNGAMMNLNRLKILDLSFNKLKWLTADDFIGLDELESLDISHNYLQTLEETSMVTIYCSNGNVCWTFLMKKNRTHLRIVLTSNLVTDTSSKAGKAVCIVQQSDQTWKRFPWLASIMSCRFIEQSHCSHFIGFGVEDTVPEPRYNQQAGDSTKR